MKDEKKDGFEEDPKKQPGDKKDPGRKRHGKRGGDRDGEDRGRKEKFTNQNQPNSNQVSALSIMENKFGTSSSYYEVIGMSVLHSMFDPSYMWTRATGNHMGVIRRKITKVAANYYAQLNSTTISSIAAQLGIVVTNSLQVFAAICYLWKVQNGLQIEDEDGFALKQVLYTTHDLSRCVQRYDIPSTGMRNQGVYGDWSISNADWKREVLSLLDSIYITDNMAQLIYTMIGHFIQFDYSDESVVRLWDVVPKDCINAIIGTTAPTPKSFTDFKTLINGYVANIDNAFNQYPFMDTLVYEFGLRKPGDKYDFTRDLPQKRLKVLADRDHALENMAYMLNNGSGTTTSLLTGYGDNMRIICANVPSVALAFYSEDKEAASELIYFDRVIVDIVNYSNALRGCIQAYDITALWKNSYTLTKKAIIAGPNPVQLTGSGSTSTDYDKAVLVGELNRLLSVIDLPNDAVFLKTGLSSVVTYSGWTDLYQGTAYYVLNPTGGDFLLSEGDIDSVSSDANFNFIVIVPEDKSVINTLGNNGKN